MTEPERVVFDCNVLFQALIAPNGPAGKALDEVVAQKLSLHISESVIEELRDVAFRPHLKSRFAITEERFDAFISVLIANAKMMDYVPHVFDFEPDPDDAHYVDLAVAVNARLIVSRDNHLLSLNNEGTKEGRDFRARFPEILILTPPQLLARLDVLESK